MKAMIFAAGLGTRLLPFTLNKPKALVEIKGKTLIDMVIKRLNNFGFNDIIINVHHFSGLIIEFLKSINYPGLTITISDETGQLLDTGGGLKKVTNFFKDGEPFLVHNVDILSDIDLEKLYRQHLQNKSLATLACMERDSFRYFLVNEKNEICGWKNTNTGESIISRENEKLYKPVAFSCIQVINPEIFELITETAAFSLTNLYLRLAKEHSLKIQMFNDSFWLDVGNKEDLEKAKDFIK